jgi:amidase
LHPAVEKALDTAREALLDAGYRIVEIEPPSVREIADEMGRTLFGEVNALMGQDIQRYGSRTFKKVYSSYLELFEPYEGQDLLLALARRSRYVREWLLFLQDYPLVLTPFMPSPTLAWDRDAQGVEGARDMLGAAIYVGAMNFLGLPAGNIAAHYNDGLPVGVQIVGRRFREDMILDACEAIEQRVGVMAHRLFERSS